MPCISSTLKRNYIVIVGLFFVEKIVSEFSVKIGLSLNKKKIQQFTIEQFSSECLIKLSRIVLVLLNFAL